MHRLNVLIFGPPSFISTLDELKQFLKFNPFTGNLNIEHQITLIHHEALKDKKNIDFIKKSNSIKIYASKNKGSFINYQVYLELPAKLKEINAIVENTVAKKKFNKNSSLEIKNYLLNKNQKKLSKLDKFIILTEKEVQLLELFLNNSNPISKDNILSSVWNYSADADTHTVEKHIYRLRKKIFDKFMDEKFILNNKDGYYF